MRSISYLVLLMLLITLSCKKEKQLITNKLFENVNSDQTGVKFINKVTEDLYFNFLNYPYIYNGGGVAVGDINNDGLEDLYFTANQGSNKLYLNQGGFKFKDITESAKVTDEDGWSTGVTMIDINNDGWLDIYVCKSGSLQSNEKRRNKLFINQKNNTFKERAKEYGLDFYGFSIQSHFFDMDKDGDLDLYLVNHRVDFRNNIIVDVERDKQIEDYASDQLFRNDNGKYINITDAAGVANKAWGLSATVGDFNNDGWPDIFVANDFFHPDYVYINNKNGTFTDESLTTFNHLSNSSMGSDYEDINNDLLPDLIVLDMLAEDHIRAKKNMASMNTNSFKIMVENGYHHQYMSNVLQLNNGNGTFSEIGQLAGISKTDWSWASLIADFDNDGFKDVFITNGIEHDLSNQDFRDQMRKNIMNRKKVTLEEAINMMPSDKLQNYIFKNNKDLTFSKVSTDWGITEKVNSNGVAYTDLDNDGDLDLVVNNQGDLASIYRNNATNNYVNFSIKGSENNVDGVGTKIYVFANGIKQLKELYREKGYQSSVTKKLHFGLGNSTLIDSAEVIWPDGKKEVLRNQKVNQTIALTYGKAVIDKQKKEPRIKSLFEVVEANKLGISYKQEENEYNDFDLQVLLPQKQSEFSKPLTVGDVNNDGLEDFFVGNAMGAAASLYIQTKKGNFINTNEDLFEKDKKYEDTNAVFFDIDNDGDLDLYVTSGGYEIKDKSELLQDRLYINQGMGKYMKAILPKMHSNTSAIAFSDYDNDNDIDVFVGGRVTHGKYPLNDKSYLLENQNGKLVDVTSEKLRDLDDLRMINDAIFSDFDNDGDSDLIIAGEWMPITIFENKNDGFSKKDISTISNMNGWFQSLKEIDIDNDGDKDYLVGNFGKNNKFHPSSKKPLHIYADYLDENTSFDMVLSKVSKSGELIPVRGKECSTEQTPFLKQKIVSYQAFAEATLPEIYGESKLNAATHYETHNFDSLLLENLGNEGFKIVNMPNQAQFSPTLSFETIDIDNDGYLDVFGVGNIYDSEVETIRYDASKGYLLLNNGKKNKMDFLNDASYFNNKEAKAVKKIVIAGLTHFIILNKRDSLTILKFNQGI